MNNQQVPAKVVQQILDAMPQNSSLLYQATVLKYAQEQIIQRAKRAAQLEAEKAKSHETEYNDILSLFQDEEAATPARHGMPPEVKGRAIPPGQKADSIVEEQSNKLKAIMYTPAPEFHMEGTVSELYREHVLKPTLHLRAAANEAFHSGKITEELHTSLLSKIEALKRLLAEAL